MNGGICTAPNTCTCPVEWSGYSCSYPVCEQGKFLKNGASALDTDAPDGIGTARSAGYYLGENGETSWVQYVPCQYDIWCTETNGFDCIQKERDTTLLNVPYGVNYRSQSGFKNRQGRCFWLELEPDAKVPFQRIDQYGGVQPRQSSYLLSFLFLLSFLIFLSQIYLIIRFLLLFSPSFLLLLFHCANRLEISTRYSVWVGW